MNRIISVIILVFILTSCNGQLINPMPGPAGGMGGQLSKSQTLEDGKIKLIVRDYLTPSTKEYPFYKYYSYLVFYDKSSSTLEKRRAASEAYMCQFSTREDVERIQLNLEDLAVFYAPVRDNYAAIQLRNSTSVSGLLNYYNYAYAQALFSSLDDTIKIDNFSLGIIASPQPLYLGKNNIPKEQIQVLDLTDLPSAQIGKVIMKFRKSVTGNYNKKVVDIILEVDPVTGVASKTEKRAIPVLDTISSIDMATKFRMIFSSVGKMFLSGEALAQESRDCI